MGNPSVSRETHFKRPVTLLTWSVVVGGFTVAIGYVLLRTTGVAGLKAVVRYDPLPDVLIAGSMAGASLLYARAIGARRPSRIGFAFGAGVFLLAQGFVHAMGLDVEGGAIQLVGLVAVIGAIMAIRRSPDPRRSSFFAGATSAVALLLLWLLIVVVNSL